MIDQPSQQQLVDLVDAYVTRSTVNFAHNHSSGAAPGGSGVFVQAGKVAGILTCKHVVTDIAQRAKQNPDGVVGLCINAARSIAFQAITMRLSEFAALPIRSYLSSKGEGHDPLFGPDIAFLRLPESMIGGLKTLGVPLNLLRQRDLTKTTPSGDDRRILSIATGVLAATQEPAVVKEAGFRVPFTTTVMSGEVARETESEGFDRLIFKPTRQELKYPDTFGGLSGGGIWQIMFDVDSAGAITNVERKLVGIAYYQTAIDADGYRNIIGHGPSSIYHRMLPDMEIMD